MIDTASMNDPLSGQFQFPRARSIENLQVAEIGNGEVVVFDPERLEYHMLNASALAVWRLCDGRRTAKDIARALSTSSHPLPDEAVELAIVDLELAGLLETMSGSTVTTIDRRLLIKSAVAAGIGGALVPAVSSITAPVAAETASECFPSIVCQVNDGQCEPHCLGLGFLFGVCNVLADPDPNNGGCCDCFNEFPGG